MSNRNSFNHLQVPTDTANQPPLRQRSPQQNPNPSRPIAANSEQKIIDLEAQRSTVDRLYKMQLEEKENVIRRQ